MCYIIEYRNDEILYFVFHYLVILVKARNKYDFAPFEWQKKMRELSF